MLIFMQIKAIVPTSVPKKILFLVVRTPKTPSNVTTAEIAAQTKSNSKNLLIITIIILGFKV